MECYNAEGNYLSPAVIFQGKSPQQQWYPPDNIGQKKLEPWIFVCTDSGYTKNDTCLEWFQRCFQPLTKRGRRDWRLLCIDGHESHVSDNFIKECAAHRVWLANFPSHATHILQPLDVSVFTSLKTYYRRYTDRMALISGGNALSKEDFLMCYHKARKDALTRRVIKSGWAKTGMWPVDVTVRWPTHALCNRPPRPSKLLVESRKAVKIMTISSKHRGEALRSANKWWN